MEAPSISRLNSQSTSGTTLINSKGGLVSPLGSSSQFARPTPNDLDGRAKAQLWVNSQHSFALTDEGQQPGKFQLVIDNQKAPSLSPAAPSAPGQWLDLRYISPKLLKDLQKQYDSQSKDEGEPTNVVAKGAAKIRAWVKQSKQGIDIRLRRKIDAKSDEVLDIRLTPEDVNGVHEKRSIYTDEKHASVPELSGDSNFIFELQDTSIAQELPADVIHETRTPTPAPSIEEMLPRYEPPISKRDPEQLTVAPLVSLSPVGDSSLAPQKTEVDVSDQDEPNGRKTDESHEPKHGRSFSGSSIMPTPARGLSVRHSADSAPATVPDPKALRKLIGGLAVAQTTRYETETDVEPPSPSDEAVSPSSAFKARKKNLKLKKPSSRRKRLNNLKDNVPSLPEGSDEEADLVEGLPRRRTVIKALPPSATAEELWSALLRIQAKILGPEHPLTYQAKHSLSLSRLSQHLDPSVILLVAFDETKNIASQMLGLVHPLVNTFCEDLETLRKLVKPDDSNLNLQAEQRISSHNMTIPGQYSPRHVKAIPKLKVDTDNVSANTDVGSVTGNSEAGIPSTDPGSAVDTNVGPPQSATSLPKPEMGFVSDDASMSSPHQPLPSNMDALFNTWRPPHKPRNYLVVSSELVFAATTKVALNSILWLQRNFGPEPAVEPGKVRVRWTCKCGEQLYDDFVEGRVGAARELEAYLNRPRMYTGNGSTPSSPSSSNGSRVFTSSSFGGPPSSQTSWSSTNPLGQSFGNSYKPSQVQVGTPYQVQYHSLPEPPWLLTCANEDRYTPKLAHLDMSPHKIQSDKDLALSLRNHYFHVNRKWWRSMKLRGLTTIEFVQFEVHQNRFTDIRKSPDMPPKNVAGYTYEGTSELLPPVGSHYLLHLFKHPEDYDGELITYLRAPKKTGRLHIGVGWGINLVEGFLPERVWMMTTSFFALASLVFAIVWAYKRDDVQGAFGVAAWICTLSALVVGWLQACLG